MNLFLLLMVYFTALFSGAFLVVGDYVLGALNLACFLFCYWQATKRDEPPPDRLQSNL